MASQIPLIRVSDRECRLAGYELAKLMEQDDEEDAAWEEARKAHKETKAMLRKAMHEKRELIRRHEREAHEGLMQEQIDALLNHEEEQRG